MKEQLVVKSIEILGIISEQNGKTGISVNNIFRKTGSKDKPLTIDSIKYLERAKLIETKKTHYKQITPKILTKLGREFVEFIDSVERYNESYQRLKHQIGIKYEILKDTNEKVRRNMLRMKGWPEERIKNYPKELEAVHQFRILISPDYITNVILSRYTSLLSELYINNNSNATHILNRILTDMLSDQFKLIVNDVEGYSNSKSIVGLKEDEHDKLTFYDVVRDKFQEIEMTMEDQESLKNTFIYEQAQDVLLSILKISKPPMGYVDEAVYGDLKTILDIYYEEQESLTKNDKSVVK